MSRTAVVAIVLATLGTVVACGSSSTDSTPAAGDGGSTSCVDFVIAEAEKTCTIAADCGFVDALHVCTGDPPCGQVAINSAGRARFERETGSITRGGGSCGKAAPVGCVKGQCEVCGSGTCPDGG